MQWKAIDASIPRPDFMPASWMNNHPLKTLLTTLWSSQAGEVRGHKNKKEKPFPANAQERIQHDSGNMKGKKAVITYHILLPWIIMFVLQPAELNLLSLQGSRTKCSLSNPWERPFLSTTSERANSTLPFLTRWTLLLQPCLINHKYINTWKTNTDSYLKL